ncbi:hypothetical protein BU107_12940 [Staphylococcus xylosus]|uniref:SA1788 family PVL leukocidin-associated protein n=1 Tax=Staphylococcus xylosus TaxID=1288 RepID=UPI000E6A03FF|nr:SA1788 family PVL leukocidin-associated protein [Staphylococcus xylosus]RIM85061.1 hypothetical protein BU107_12940 [Staphylococcus xylosus]
MKPIRIKDKTFHVTEKYKAKAESLNIGQSSIRTRLKNGWTIEEAHTVPIRVSLDDYREAQFILQMQSEAKKVKETLKEERHKQKRPWLYDGTPQQHSRSIHVEKLMHTSAFPKIKTDTYGNTQLI